MACVTINHLEFLEIRHTLIATAIHCGGDLVGVDCACIVDRTTRDRVGMTGFTGVTRCNTGFDMYDDISVTQFHNEIIPA